MLTAKTATSAIRAASRPALSPMFATRMLSTSSQRPSLFGRLFGRESASSSTSSNPAPPTSSATASQPTSTASTNAQSIPKADRAADATVKTVAKAPSTGMKGKMLTRDQELLAKLLDREGGSAGVTIVNGKYEEGLGPETKKNMFRLI